jgi:drug/metabolite transporter (DMT)-like permease
MRFAGELAALGTACCWSVGSNLFAAAGRRMTSPILNRLRITVAVVLLGAALLAIRGAPWPTWATRFQVILLAASGLVGFVFGDGWYFRSLVILGAGRAALLASSAPIFTALLGIPLLGERLGPQAWIGMGLTVGGMAWVMHERQRVEHVSVEGSAIVGVVAGLLGAVGQAGGYVISKLALRTGIDPISATVIRVDAAAVGVWILALAQGTIPASLAALRDRRGASFMVGGAFFGPFLGVTLSLTALHFIEAGVAASITAIYPVFTMLIAARFHGEHLSARSLLGAIVSVVGVVVLFMR